MSYIITNNPHFKIGWQNQTGTTTISTQNIWYKPSLGVAALSYADGFIIDANKYILSGSSVGSSNYDLTIWISGTLKADQTTTTTWQICMFKNGNTGTTYGSMNITTDQSNRAFNYSTNIYIENSVKNDFYEFYLRNTTNNSVNVITVDLNILCLSHI